MGKDSQSGEGEAALASFVPMRGHADYPLDQG